VDSIIIKNVTIDGAKYIRLRMSIWEFRELITKLECWFSNEYRVKPEDLEFLIVNLTLISTDIRVRFLHYTLDIRKKLIKRFINNNTAK
jgi:hypothetical protein